MVQPSLVVLDEPTSGLDVSVQAIVLRLFLDLRERFGLTYLFISHDLAVVRLMSQRIAVMYLGKVVELGATEQIFSAPRHPYTQSLLASVPVAGGRRVSTDFTLEGEPPNPANKPDRLCVSHALLLARAVLRCAEIEAAITNGGGRDSGGCVTSPHKMISSCSSSECPARRRSDRIARHGRFW